MTDFARGALWGGLIAYLSMLVIFAIVGLAYFNNRDKCRETDEEFCRRVAKRMDGRL